MVESVEEKVAKVRAQEAATKRAEALSHFECAQKALVGWFIVEADPTQRDRALIAIQASEEAIAAVTP